VKIGYFDCIQWQRLHIARDIISDDYYSKYEQVVSNFNYQLELVRLWALAQLNVNACEGIIDVTL